MTQRILELRLKDAWICWSQVHLRKQCQTMQTVKHLLEVGKHWGWAQDWREDQRRLYFIDPRWENWSHSSTRQENTVGGIKEIAPLQNKVSKVADKVTKNKVTKCHTDQVRLGLVRAASWRDCCFTLWAQRHLSGKFLHVNSNWSQVASAQVTTVQMHTAHTVYTLM